MKRSSLLMFLVCALTLLFGVAPLVQADWDPDVDSHKMHYPQLPDLSPNGMDVLAGPLSFGDDPAQVYEKFLADDWTCSATGPVTEIHIWGSYNYDIVLVDMPFFSLVIYEDIPADPDVIGSYSRPGAVLWQRYTQATAERILPIQVYEQFYDPNPNEIIGSDTQVWQYNFDIPEAEALVQEQGTVYWLGVHYSFDLNQDGWVSLQDFIVLRDSWPGVFGWKTSGSQHHLDDAVWTDVMTYQTDGHIVPSASTQWRELRYPAVHEMAGMSIDLAFVINGPEEEDDLDFGDAPEDVAGVATNYPTKLPNGARHVADGVNYLGQLEDVEPDGQPTLPADGDDINPLAADDEDGVIFMSGGLTAGVGEPVDVFVSPVGGPGGYLNVWIDYNADFDWDDTGEYVLVDQPVAGGMNNLTITAPAGAVVGPTYARFRYTTYQILGTGLGYSGQANDGEVEDYRVQIIEELEEEYSKWIQQPHGPEQGFDEASNIWIHEETEIIKWEQLPNPQLSGLHSHDEGDFTGYYAWVKCADDFQCQGGDITDVHWWGNYENDDPKGGIAAFHLSLHRCNSMALPWHLPMEPEAWGWDVPFSMCNQTDTGMVNNMGEIIYSYKVDLPDPYQQIEGEWYWLDVMAKSIDKTDAAIWRWQEAQRASAPMGPLGHAPAADRTNTSPWSSIIWPNPDPERYSDMAFAITSQDSTTTELEVNKVVADDFVSDGRVIKKLRWWGSYFDDRYEMFVDPMEPYVIDGWIISFHHTQDDAGTNLSCPPDIMAGSVHPTALGLYFAPAYAVEIMPMSYQDCPGHNVYEYKVDLSQCHLICQEVDPRSGTTPAQFGAFQEEECFKYWLDIVAVVGATWDNGDIIYTGHMPSDMTVEGNFWGWHTSPDANLEEACSGQIVDMTPPTPFCWDYGNWYKVPWQCPTPVQPPVNMSFELITPEEGPATCFVGSQAEFAVWCGWGQPPNWCGDCWRFGDIDGDCAITFADVQIVYGDFLNPTTPGALTGRSDNDMDGAITFADVQIVYGAFLPPTVLCPDPCIPYNW